MAHLGGGLVIDVCSGLGLNPEALPLWASTLQAKCGHQHNGRTFPVFLVNLQVKFVNLTSENCIFACTLD
jgi:hypothetical protein